MTSYMGMDAATGRRLSGRAHLCQSVSKLLTTWIGSRLRRRRVGCIVPGLIDAPANRATVLQLYAGIATALMAWEPRLRLRSVIAKTDPTRPGWLSIEIQGEAVIDGVEQSVNVVTPIRS